MNIPLTALTTLIGSFVMLGAWLFIGHRIRHSQAAVLRPIYLLHNFFIFMGLFFVIMWLPHLWLNLDPAKFPQYMAWGYVVGHIFLYLAFISIARMTCNIIPRLASKESLVAGLGIVLIIGITWINAATMIWGTQPTFNYERQITQFNAAPIVGASIGILAALSVFPAAVLFIINGIRNPARRVRSLLLGVGLLLLMTAGPLHDTARTAELYIVADVFSMLSIVLVGTGVVYRLEQSLSLSRTPVLQTSSSS